MKFKKKRNVKWPLLAMMIAIALVMNSLTASAEIVTLKKGSCLSEDRKVMGSGDYDILLEQAMATQKYKSNLDICNFESKKLEQKVDNRPYYFWGGVALGFLAAMAAVKASK